MEFEDLMSSSNLDEMEAEVTFFFFFASVTFVFCFVLFCFVLFCVFCSFVFSARGVIDLLLQYTTGTIYLVPRWHEDQMYFFFC